MTESDPSDQRAKYERVLATFGRGEAVRVDAPAGGSAVYLATYSGLTHVWFADDAPRPDRDEGPRATHFAYRASLAAEAGDDLEMSGFGPWIRALLLLVPIDDIESVSLLDSPFIDPDANTESGIGFRDPDPVHIYEVSDSNVDTDTELTGL
ncbi:MAG TPA: hypothetical protein VFJ06_03705 [Halococcus sp.]|nr:hypothetical protein [Halococcus sp.]